MTQVLLIRAGATLYDEERRIQGVLDIPLSERGREEARLLATHLVGSDASGLYCGPGSSVRATAEEVGRALGLRPRPVAELRNLDHGLWHGLQVEEIKRRHAKVYRQWIEEPLTVCPPLGEPVADALDRVRQALRPLLRRHRDETFGLVVGEPLAQLISGYLRCQEHVQLDDDVPTGGFERIGVVADV